MTGLRGKFIVFDGGEGCGKSTQARLMRDRLEAEHVPVVLVHDPGSTDIGEMVRAILLNPANKNMAMRCEMLLYMASRAQMMAEKVLPALEEGWTVLSDRFVSSTIGRLSRSLPSRGGLSSRSGCVTCCLRSPW
jgi:dTMP kinase